MAKTYDALNRLSSQVTQGWGLGIGYCSGATYGSSYEMFYNWGPDGHVIRIGSPPVVGAPPFGTVSHETIHWDGDVPLFTTNSTGQLDDIKIGTLGDVTPLDPTFTGLTLWDRDYSGTIVSDHNSSGYDTTVQPNPYHKTYCNGAFNGSANFTGPSTMAGNPGMFVGQGTLLSEPGSDGIYDGANIIQGVRTYDSTANTWTTPDAFAGDILDPMSQRSYVWNRNNPEMYSDPTGFDPFQNFLISVVGVADQASFGLGPALRAAMGESSYVDTSSTAYKVGSGVGLAATMVTGGGEARIAEEGVTVAAEATDRLVIGKMADIGEGSLAPGERTLASKLTPGLGSPKANWGRNFSELRAETRSGQPIRDGTVDASGNLTNNTGFLRAERNAMQNKGWTYDSKTTLWSPPTH